MIGRVHEDHQPGGKHLSDMSSSTVPSAELKVCGSRCAASMSSNRLSAQKSSRWIAVHRGFPAHLRPDRVGIVLAAHVEWVPVELAHRPIFTDIGGGLRLATPSDPG